jgi:hypothetical protein
VTLVEYGEDRVTCDSEASLIDNKSVTSYDDNASDSRPLNVSMLSFLTGITLMVVETIICYDLCQYERDKDVRFL